MNKKYLYLLGIFLALITVLSFFLSIKAESSGEGLTISPPLTEISLKDGDTSIQTIRLSNPTDEIVEVYPKAMDFGAKGEGGEPAFSEANDESRRFSLAKWISFSQPKIALAKDQVVDFKYSISVPDEAEPGGHYGVVFFVTEPPNNDQEETKVGLGSMIGSLVLVKVPGQIVEMASIEDFLSDKSMSFGKPIKFTTRIANLGNIHLKPKGQIIVENSKGKKVGESIFNEEKGNVLPDSIRKFENNIETNKFSFGKYTAQLKIIYGEKEKELIKEFTFWVVPIAAILVIALVILMALMLIVLTFFWAKKKRQKKAAQKNRVLLR